MKRGLSFKCKVKYITLIIIVSIFSNFICACNYDESKSSYISKVQSSVSINEIPDEIESGTLRIWMQNPQSFNPLISKDLQWKNMTYLFYDSLYKMDLYQNAIESIAIDQKTTEDNLIHTITIKRDLMFHDGTPLEASDIVYSFQSIKALGKESLYNQQLENVEIIEEIDTNKIKVILSKPDRFLKQRLIFPIISDEFDMEDNNIPSGSGPYKIKSIDEKQVIAELYSKSEDYKIRKIDISILEDTREGMKLFGEDEVDIVLFNDDLYINYYLRTDANIIRYPGRTFLFFQLNKTEKLPFADNKMVEEFKRIVYSEDVVAPLAEKLIIPSKFPFIETIDTSNDYVYNNKINSLAQLKDKLRIVYMADDLIENKIIQNLEKAFIAYEIQYELQPLKQDKYNEALDKGDYDIALRKAVLDGTPDPGWLYLNEYKPYFPNSTALNVGNGEDYKENALALYKTMYEDLTENLSEKLINISGNSPFIGIGFKINAVLVSKRVKGDLRSNSFDPYNNIKDVWIWLGS